MISTETRDKWDSKINAVIEAWEKDVIKLDDYDRKYIFDIKNKRNMGFDLTFRQSKFLNRLYNRLT